LRTKDTRLVRPHQRWPTEEMIKEGYCAGIQGISSSIARPIVETNNFELRLKLVSMIKQSQFEGLPMEDPNLQLSIFLEVCDTLKMNGVSTNAIRLPYSHFHLQIRQGHGSIRCL